MGQLIDQRSLMFSTGISKVLSLKNILPLHHTDKKPLRACSDTLSLTSDINHVLTPCHVTEINYVDRGVAARTPLQFLYFPFRSQL